MGKDTMLVFLPHQVGQSHYDCGRSFPQTLGDVRGLALLRMHVVHHKVLIAAQTPRIQAACTQGEALKNAQSSRGYKRIEQAINNEIDSIPLNLSSNPSGIQCFPV